MPRAFTTDERNTVAAAHVWHLSRCEVMDVDGTWQDLSDLGPDGVDTYIGATISTSIDANVWQATVRVRLGYGEESLSPLMLLSLFNVDVSDVYAPLLNCGSRIRLWAKTMLPTDVEGDIDEKLIFDGRIDVPSFTSDPMTLTCRDLGGKLIDTIIRRRVTYGDKDSPVPAADVIQQILTDAADLLGESITLVVPDEPTFVITENTIENVSVMDAITGVATLFGWVVRYKFQDDGSFALTLYDPQRDKADPDYTLEPTEYIAVDNASLDFTNGRNFIDVWYTDGVTGEPLKVTVKDDGSIAAFGEKYEALGGDALKSITNGNDALALAEFALADQSRPIFDHVVRNTFTWFAEPSDYVGFAGNNVHYDEPQALGLSSITHEFPDGGQGPATTSLQCRGKPAGAYERWLRLQGGPIVPMLPPTPEFSEPMGEGMTYGRADMDGDLILKYGFKDGVDEIRMFATRGSGPNLPVPDLSETAYAFAIRRPEGNVGKDPNYSSIAVISTLKDYYKRLVGVGTRAGLTSPAWTSGVVQATDPSPPIVRGTMAALAIATDVDAGTNTVTATPASLDPDAESWMVIVRNEHELPPIHIGTSLDPVVFPDDGLDLGDPNKAWTYDAFVLTTRDDDGVLKAVTGQRFRQQVEKPAGVPPEFALGTPVAAVVGGAKVIQISWTGATPGASVVRVEASLDRIAVRSVGTGSLASGTIYDPNTAVKSYRLVAESALGVRVAVSDWRLFTESPGPVSNPGAIPVFINDTPKPVLATSFPRPTIRLSVQWKAATPGARVIQIQRSTDNGVSDPWTEVARSAAVATGTWISPTQADAALDAYYRLRALGTVDDPPLAVSAVKHYVPTP